MSEERRFGWFGAIAFFLAGCLVTFFVLRFWPKPTSYVPPTQSGYWKFETDFAIPSSFTVTDPNKIEILTFDIGGSPNVLVPYPVTIKNRSDQSRGVSYEIFAYDSQHRRVDSLTDGFTLGPKEAVLRQWQFDHPISADRRTFKSFHILANVGK